MSVDEMNGNGNGKDRQHEAEERERRIEQRTFSAAKLNQVLDTVDEAERAVWVPLSNVAS
jgi:hypothetical protein